MIFSRIIENDTVKNRTREVLTAFESEDLILRSKHYFKLFSQNALKIIRGISKGKRKGPGGGTLHLEQNKEMIRTHGAALGD